MVVDPESLRSGQLVELIVSVRAYPSNKGRKVVSLHLWAIRIVSRSPAVVGFSYKCLVWMLSLLK